MASNLPDYVAAAKPVPPSNRIPWYKSTAQTYAGIMLWFVFWQSVPPAGAHAGGVLGQGLGVALVGLVLAALACHFLYYLVPGMLGLKTGLPLYIVGTSTYGAQGGFLMPGFLMGLLQFGWLGVNAYFSALLLAAPFYGGVGPATGTPLHFAIGVGWAIAAAFMGLKGVQYVARVATFFPLIPLTILIVLFVASVGGLSSFDAQKYLDVAKAAPDAAAAAPLSAMGAVAALLTMIIGFFATAGAAGADFGMNNRDARDVQLGGLVGIAGSTILAGGLALLIVAGTHGMGKNPDVMDPTALMNGLIGDKLSAVFWYLLAIAAFPSACFSALIAANSFKTTLPKLSPFISVGIGTLVSIVLVVTQLAGSVSGVFGVIGASFGPVCGAMAADYLLAGKTWAGPRAGFNPAGWISWVIGFAVGGFNLVAAQVGSLQQYSDLIPVPPLSALIVGFVLYFVLAKLGLQSRVLEMPAAEQK